MKFNNLIVFSAIFWCIGINGLFGSDDRFLSDYKQRLQLLSLPEFLIVVEKQNWNCPKIYSKWYIEDKLDSSVQINLEREIGFLFLKKIEDEIGNFYATGVKNEVNNERMMSLLIECGNHVATAKGGYGNFLLLNRCEELAYVVLAYLAIDSEYPYVTNFYDKLRAISKKKELVLVYLYKNERGQSNLSVSSSVKSLKSDWERGNQGLSKWMKKMGESSSSLGADLRGRLPKNLIFYCDDLITKVAKPRTTQAMWNGKFHSYMIDRFKSKTMLDVEKFIKYRMEMKRFPIKTPAWWKKGDAFFETPIKAAFYESWKGREGNLYATASEVFLQVKNNSFYDFDTKLKQLDNTKVKN